MIDSLLITYYISYAIFSGGLTSTYTPEPHYSKVENSFTLYVIQQHLENRDYENYSTLGNKLDIFMNKNKNNPFVNKYMETIIDNFAVNQLPIRSYHIESEKKYYQFVCDCIEDSTEKAIGIAFYLLNELSNKTNAIGNVELNSLNKEIDDFFQISVLDAYSLNNKRKTIHNLTVGDIANFLYLERFLNEFQQYTQIIDSKFLYYFNDNKNSYLARLNNSIKKLESVKELGKYMSQLNLDSEKNSENTPPKLSKYDTGCCNEQNNPIKTSTLSNNTNIINNRRCIGNKDTYCSTDYTYTNQIMNLIIGNNSEIIYNITSYKKVEKFTFIDFIYNKITSTQYNISKFVNYQLPYLNTYQDTSINSKDSSVYNRLKSISDQPEFIEDIGTLLKLKELKPFISIVSFKQINDLYQNLISNSILFSDIKKLYETVQFTRNFYKQLQGESDAIEKFFLNSYSANEDNIKRYSDQNKLDGMENKQEIEYGLKKQYLAEKMLMLNEKIQDDLRFIMDLKEKYEKLELMSKLMGKIAEKKIINKETIKTDDYADFYTCNSENEKKSENDFYTCNSGNEERSEDVLLAGDDNIHRKIEYPNILTALGFSCN